MEFPLSGARTGVSGINPMADSKPVVWSVFPNPSHGLLMVNYQSAQDQGATLSLHDASGVLLGSKRVTLNKGSNEIEWDINGVPSGVYFITIDQKGAVPLKIIKE